MTGSAIAAANALVSNAFVEGLIAAGCEDVCITPGSRSTPLTIAFATQTQVRPWLHLDERSAAYFALGLARAKVRPVALVCTSGTAAANYAPAVVEANLSRIPLIVCTADRPPRLRDAGASQTIDQVAMFGTNPRWALDLPVPAGSAGEPALFRSVARRAISSAMGPLAGPVHLNFPFEEPLTGPPGEVPAPAFVPAPRAPERPAVLPRGGEVEAAAAGLAAAQRPLIVAGPETGGLPAAAIAALAAALDAPILADPLSGLRTGPHDRARVLDAYDAVLRTPLPAAYLPDCVLRFGAAPTSKALGEFLAAAPGAAQILVEQPGGWRDPGAVATQVVTGDARSVAEAFLRALPPRAGDTAWAARWLAADRAAGAALRRHAAATDELHEGRIFIELQALLPEGATLVAGNSMPVRDLDSFFAGDARARTLVANRGAAGIDGVTSSALGAAAAGGRVVLVVGDISFYHDMNGLWAALRHGLSLTVVLVNNNGGGIFHYLPQAAHGSVFEEWFATPPNLDFSHAARLYGGRYTCARDWEAFRTAFACAEEPGLHVIELPTDRARNVALHREGWAAAAAAVRATFEGA